MLFDSPAYFLFLVAVVFLYWRLSWRRQNALLLCASYFFYGWWDWRFASGSLGPEFFRDDRFHLNEKGAKVFTDAIVRDLRARLVTQ